MNVGGTDGGIRLGLVNDLSVIIFHILITKISLGLTNISPYSKCTLRIIILCKITFIKELISNIKVART